MSKKTYKLIRFIFGFCFILYIILSSGIIDDIKKSYADVSKVINTDENKEINNENIEGNLYVYFIDVGQADSILIRNNNHNMLIDAGNNEDGKKLVSYFKSLGIEKFDYVVGTHPHEDHIGGMDDIISNFDIEEYLMPNKISTSKTFEDVLDALISKNMQFTVPKIGDKLKLGDANLNIVYLGEEVSDANDSSIVLKLSFGSNTFLFTGDASSKVENKILKDDIQTDVLKIGHHGSQYSSSDEFLNKVNPRYAVIEVGKNNIYDHPKQITLDKLNSRNIKIYRTDLDGTIIFTSDGNTIKVTLENTDTNG